MSHLIELSDSVYRELIEVANQKGDTPAGWIEQKLHVNPDLINGENSYSKLKTAQSLKTQNAWDVLDTMTGSLEAPEDWSAEHDRYFVVAPKLYDNTKDK